MPHITITDGLTTRTITIDDALTPRETLDLCDRLRDAALAVALRESERRTAAAVDAIAGTVEARGEAYERARGAYWLSD